MYNPSPKIKTSPKKGTFQKEVIFQASFFKGHVSFSGEYTYIYSIPPNTNVDSRNDALEMVTPFKSGDF